MSNRRLTTFRGRFGTVAAMSNRSLESHRASARRDRPAAALAAGLLLACGMLAATSAGAAVIPLAGRYADEVRSVPMSTAEPSRRQASAATRTPSTGTPPTATPPAPAPTRSR